MEADLKSIMKLEVPIVVVLGQRPLKINEIRNWIPGSIIELAKGADDDLEVRVNNKPIGTGAAVKVGENFGIRVNTIGDPGLRITAMGPPPDPDAPLGTSQEDADSRAVDELLQEQT